MLAANYLSNVAGILSLMEDDSNEVNDTRGNEAGSKDETNEGKEQVGKYQECLLC